jgi:hypothetical protein
MMFTRSPILRASIFRSAAGSAACMSAGTGVAEYVGVGAENGMWRSPLGTMMSVVVIFHTARAPRYPVLATDRQCAAQRYPGRFNIPGI